MNRSFAITINTRVGLNERFKENVVKWLKNQPYAAWVYEKEGNDEHIHAQIWLDAKRTKGNVDKPIKKILKRCFDDSDYIWNVAVVVKGAYNDDFVEKYMSKDGDLESGSVVPENTEEYYPSQEEQDAFMDVAESRKNWSLWKDLEGKWTEGTDINEFTVATFLAQEMWVNKSIKVEMDGRKRCQMCQTFTAFMTGTNDGRGFLAKEKHQLYGLMTEGV